MCIVNNLTMTKGSDTPFSLPSLLCQEDDSFLNELDDTTTHLIPHFSFSQSDDEYMQMLIKKETDTIIDSNSSVSSLVSSEEGKNWLKWTRLDAIRWTLNTSSSKKFHIRTAYVSLTYFDRFLSRRSIDERKIWVIRLLAVACLSLAAKMEEINIPSLSGYYVEDYHFENIMIMRMELMVLKALEWRMGSITPFEFIRYFITKFYADFGFAGKLDSRVTALVSSAMEGISLIDRRPSVIAAAAVLAASDNQLTRTAMELKINVIASWGSAEKEQIYDCYVLLVEIEKEKYKTPKSLISNIWSSHSSSGGF